MALTKTSGTVSNIQNSPIENSTTLYPEFKCRAWVNFYGVQSGTLSYTISGNLVTITQTSHGMTTGMIANLNFSSGTVSGTANYVITYLTDNTYTVVSATSGSTGGNVVRNTFIRASGNVNGVSRTAAGDYTISFTTTLPDINYAINSTAHQDTVDNEAMCITVLTRLTNSFRIRFGHYNGGTYNLRDCDYVGCGVFR